MIFGFATKVPVPRLIYLHARRSCLWLSKILTICGSFVPMWLTAPVFSALVAN
jgi:hypothetical protein